MGNEVLILLAEAITLYLIVLSSHALRYRFGLAYFYGLIGGLTAIMSWITDAGVVVEVGAATFVIGSTVFYTALLLSVFVVYVFDGPRRTRVAISTVLLVSILVPLVAAVLHLQMRHIGAAGMIKVPVPDFRINAASALATLIDLLFLAIAWEFLGRPGFKLKLWFRAYATLLGVMWLDVVLFATGAFAGTPGYLSIMKGTLVSRFLVSLLAFPFLYVYLYWQNRQNGIEFDNRPLLAILQRVAEAESELSNVKKEIEKRKQAEAALRKSEALLAATGKMAKVGGWEIDSETRELYWTPETYRIHQVHSGRRPSLEEALDFYPPEDSEKLTHALKKAFETGEPYDMELRFITAKGRRLWVRTICQPCIVEGKVTKLTGTFQDISERKELERSLAEYRDHLEGQVVERTRQLSLAKKQWENTFDAISDWVAIIDEDYRIVRSNMASSSLFGLPPGRVLGRRCFEVVHHTPLPHADCPLKKLIDGHRRQSLEFQTLDGRWLQVLVDPLDGDTGQRHFVHIVRDITDLKKKDNELLAARKAEAFSILAGGIAHDYNNLLSIIWGNISLLREEVTSADCKDYFSEAEKACVQAKSLTHQFITLSEGAVLNKSLQSVRMLLMAVVQKTRETKDLDVSIDIPDGISPVDVDPDMLSIAFQHIIVNAAEAMPAGGRLSIRAEQRHAPSSEATHNFQLDLIFEDNGRGIPESDLPKVFDPYFTTKAWGSRRGMGLGLAVSLAILQKHGGMIRIDSIQEQGTTVTVRLPPTGAAGALAEVDGSQTQPSSATILVMEDHRALRKLCGQMIKRLHLQVISAGNGHEAVEKYKAAVASKEAVDLVLLDQNIEGGIGGVETLKKLRAVGYRNPAVVVTGSPSSPTIMDFTKHGFDANLLKPYIKNDLKEVIGRFLPV